MQHTRAHDAIPAKFHPRCHITPVVKNYLTTGVIQSTGRMKSFFSFDLLGLEVSKKFTQGFVLEKI
jgi:hypothetical protein